ncbi:hypothetical protein KSP39_PZI004380 [Platanthera zijinensis]|uniref:Uncharacterized protein n=1 Tax=Platanthera zijinensis TaxID=2320716 RepID=A0AAP0GCY6_9ASPA
MLNTTAERAEGCWRSVQRGFSERLARLVLRGGLGRIPGGETVARRRISVELWSEKEENTEDKRCEMSRYEAPFIVSKRWLRWLCNYPHTVTTNIIILSIVSSV